MIAKPSDPISDHIAIPDSLVVVGKVGAPHGIRGWITVHSFTVPRENILEYLPWFIKYENDTTWQPIEVVDVRIQSKGLLALFNDCEDRTTAGRYVNAELGVPRNSLPVLPEDEYYWSDLTGLIVRTTSGKELGKIDHVFATGANDVLVVKGDKEYLVPYVKDQVVKNVDLKTGTMLVDWDPDF